MELIDLIRNSLLFSGLSDIDLSELAAITERRSFDRDEIIFRQNDEAKGFYLLISGSIKLSNVSPVNGKKTFNFVTSGETFAEAAFFNDRKYQCEAQARSTGEALYFPKLKFHELIRRNPNPALNLLGHLTFMVRQLARKFRERTHGDVASRVATFFVGRIAEKSITSCGNMYLDVGIKKGELALKLGVAKETLSRSFKKLKDQGILEVQKNRVIIYKLEELENLCELSE